MGEDSVARRSVWALMIVALLYSAVHFTQSGVLFPLRQQNLAKFDEQTPALRAHMATGNPVRFENPVQYGPVFFFVVHPLLRFTQSTQAFSNWLYAIQLFCIAVGFLVTCATLKPLMPRRDLSLILAGLAVLWLNFAPLYTILVVKSVETWELCLLSIALYAYVRDRTWLMGTALAAAVLVKVLPAIFFFYLLITNRRAFVRACVALVVILAVSHLLYGPEMGLLYLPQVARTAAGNSYGLLWHENLSVKAAIAKMFGHLATPDIAAGRGGSTLVMTDVQLRIASIIGDIVVLIGLALLTWTWFRTKVRTRDTILWEWSFVTVALLILSPNTTFEYATLAMGAISYALVSALRSPAPLSTWLPLGGALFFLGALLPRQVLNQLTFVDALTRWSGYAHLTPSEAYQYYCFPLLGLFLLAIALWRIQPSPAGSVAPVGP